MPRVLHALLLAVLPMLLAGCATSAANTPPVSQPTTQAGQVTPILAASELLVGTNRFPIGLIRSGAPLNDPLAQVQIGFLRVNGGQATPVGEPSTATYFGQGLPGAVYVVYPRFEQAGEWMAEVRSQLGGEQQQRVSRMRFSVLERSQTLAVGDQAVAVQTPTAREAALERISSAPMPNPALYQLSLDEALGNGKPTVVLFGTPGFCKTATCGPSYAVLGALQQQFGARANFIHVEVYTYPFSEAFTTGSRTPPMQAWGLTSEPWLFLIDTQGKVAARYEGGITGEELTPAVEQLLSVTG